MSGFPGKLVSKAKRFVVDVVVEPLIPLRMLESYLVFWARFVFRIRKPFVIGVTGSVGKSTTTAMIAAVLSDARAEQLVGRVGHTSDNMNDDLGLSATLLRFEKFYVLPWRYSRRFGVLLLMPFRALRVAMSRYPKVMVLEFGVGSTANFRRLVTIAPPNVSVVTRIGAAHLEKLKTIEGVLQEKGELVRAVAPTGLVVLGQDHDYVSQLELMARAPVIKVSGQGTELSRNATRAVCRHMGIPDEVVSSVLSDFKSPKGRLNRMDFVKMTVIDDSYNANPMSMHLALDTLAESARPEQRRVAVLGYMAELGEEGPGYHREVGAHARARADMVVGVGDRSRLYEPDHWFEGADACAQGIVNLLGDDDCVLVKGSFSAQMERVVDALREIGERRQSQRKQISTSFEWHGAPEEKEPAAGGAGVAARPYANRLPKIAGNPVSAAISRIRQGVKWRLARHRTHGAQKVKDIYSGVEWRLRRLAWKVYSQSVYRLAFLHRRSLRRTAFVGITGSAGKTTTKDLVASILERHLPRGRMGSGTLNGPYDVARLLLRTRASDAYCVTEIAITNDANIDLPVALFRPTVGVVTSIGGEHVSAYGNLDGIAEEKSKLIRSLPARGIAILNADDPRVLAMRARFSGRTITYGMSGDAMLRGEAVEASWPDRLSLTVKWNGQSARVQTQLCGRHWVPVVLAALATGVALGVPLTAAADAVASVEPFEGRMSPVEFGDGVTFIRDDWKAPFWSLATTFDFMRQARAARKIIVVGTISDYSGPYTPRYVSIARQALAVADCVIFAGPRASACLRAKRNSQDQLFAFPSLRNASAFLSSYLRPGDLVLLKGSIRTDHLERLILARTTDVQCWRSGCGRGYFCNQCSLLRVASDPEAPNGAFPAELGMLESATFDIGCPSGRQSTVCVVGLGNPGERYIATRHNVGQSVVDILARRLSGTWTREGDLAMVMRTHWAGQAVWLLKLLTPINDAGPTLLPLAQELCFSLNECILVHDDLDLPVGTVRARYRGGDGGHRGVQSILQAFQDDKVRRVKIGIGKPGAGEAVTDYVLTPFPPEQAAAVDAASRAAGDRVLELIREASSPVARTARTTPAGNSPEPSISPCFPTD